MTANPQPKPSSPTTAPLYWLTLFTAILLLKSLILAADHAPMFFLGDSVSYLYTAISDWIPGDRSFLYGRLIRLFCLKSHSLANLLLAQSLASALSALLIAVILRRCFAASRLIAALMAILCALEPLQLLYERYIMTEPFSLLAFALFTAVAISAIQRPSLLKIALFQLAGVLLVSLRVSFLPLIETATLLVPVLSAFATASKTTPRFPLWLSQTLAGRGPFSPEGPPNPHLPPQTRNPPKLQSLLTHPLPRTVLHLLLSCTLFLLLHNAYKRAYANLIQHELPGAPPAYYYENGYHLLAFVLPIVKPADFPHPEKAGQIFNNPALDPSNYYNRDKNRWWPDGIIDRLKSAYPNPLESNQLANQTAWNALYRNPLGELHLALLGYLDYFNPARLQAGLLTDQGGDRELPDELLSLLQTHFHLQAQSQPHLITFTNRYFFLAWPWFLALLFLPIPALLAIYLSPKPHRPAALLLFTFIALQTAIIAAFSLSPTVRFLHSTAWLAMLIAGILLSRIHWQKNTGSRD